LLIAERRAARSARAILTAKAVKAVQCETLADAIARAGEIDPSVVLLFAEGSTRELARAIEALRGAFAQSSVILITPSIERWELRAALAAWPRSSRARSACPAGTDASSRHPCSQPVRSRSSAWS
jgi:hypothetical protein